MSSLRRINSSRANGARSRGPVTPEGKERASANALRHGLLAECVVLENESNECFDDLVTQHIQRFAPADGVEFAMVEEMAAANWRMRRAWAIENRLMDKAIGNQPPGDDLSRLADAFSQLAASPELSLLHRYEARLPRIYQRALNNVLMLGEPELPKEPSPISEQSAPLSQFPGRVGAHQEVDLPTPCSLPVSAAASQQIASSLGNHAIPNEPSPIFGHPVAQFPDRATNWGQT